MLKLAQAHEVEKIGALITKHIIEWKPVFAAVLGELDAQPAQRRSAREALGFLPRRQ